MRSGILYDFRVAMDTSSHIWILRLSPDDRYDLPYMSDMSVSGVQKSSYRSKLDNGSEQRASSL